MLISMSRAMGIVAFCAGLASSPAHAGFMDGNDLYKECTDGQDKQVSTHWQSYALCLGYLKGVVDTSQVSNCLPNKVQGGQIYDIAFNYLRSHPATRQDTASSLVEQAIKEAFCK
ncbi:hypothetical protein GUK30_15345 [Rhizobium leguminosarum]|uniref:Rap1a/Tai family immunity protein n=1 Tax=Rhizobium ruizarguesonis TaxID=2081791 RepID=UPI00042A3F24|nr:Rap1a/Tai family immunity protein [Rhizobium ruizarguesonis]NKL26972.1 hypothetical protein [Rhizobium leguminosarum bv. viciae]NEH67693.1 hypothetical protein [Rhizobium ruizarguesonis]NEI20787.1 hypothetical protein [Rhizobium ruizarguesonis]NEI32311.1 hypothetical protein [Rhizobium ruizarguesonis]TBB82818.1 hypothetical protein ELH38_32850 [Rhizobium ruizarguesonis]